MLTRTRYFTLRCVTPLYQHDRPTVSHSTFGWARHIYEKTRNTLLTLCIRWRVVVLTFFVFGARGEQNSRAAIVTEVQHCRTCEEGAEAAIRELRREVDSLTVSRDLHVRNEKGLIEMRRELITLLKQKQGSASTGYEYLESDGKELLAEHLQERRKFADQKEWWEASTKYAFAQMEIELKNLLDQQRMELMTFSDEVRKVLNEGGVVSRLEELEAQCCAERSSRMAMEEDFRALLEDQSRLVPRPFRHL